MAVEAGRRVVIVGASAAGLKCACRLARLRPGWEITVVEQREEFSYAACGLPYVLAGDIAGPDALRRTSDGALRDVDYFAAVKGVKVRTPWRAGMIDPESQTLSIVAPSGEEEELVWDDLVLATGARPRRLAGQPDHPRVRSFHTLDDLAPLARGLSRGEIGRVALVGGGPVGCELAEAFRALWGCEVRLFEAAPAPLPGILDCELGALVGRVLLRGGIALHCGRQVTAIKASDEGVTIEDGRGVFAADLAVVAVGVEPAVELAAAAGGALGPSGAIAVDERFATTIPHLWAVGDCIEVKHAVTGEPAHLPFGSLANRQGRTLANILAGRIESFPPVAGAVAVKVFEWNVAAVGCTRAAAAARGLAARSVWVTAHDRAHYWPEAKEIVIHLVYDQATRRVLGVQTVGEGEVTKRVDVAAQLILRGATLEDFANLEHAYAPPYAPALDPLMVAAYAAQNQEDGVVACPPFEDLTGEHLLDLRHPQESAERPCSGASVTAMPLEGLREEGASLAIGPWLAVCERGTRAAEALRWLQGHGKYARYLGGGLRLRSMVMTGVGE
ncbi:MAG: FAD-dependent oxidoreductase [Acidobacteriota bacterium]